VKHRRSRTLLIGAVAYTAILMVAGVAALILYRTTTYGARLPSGCNFYDALLVGVECRGFFGASVAEVVLGLPVMALQLTMLAPFFPPLVPFAVLVWSPVLYLLFRFYDTLRRPDAT
jgi:hypothetical protein